MIDHGVGIPANDREKIFEKFVRLENHLTSSAQGNGLGLYICRQIMHKMNGELFAERQEEGMGFGIVFQMA